MLFTCRSHLSVFCIVTPRRRMGCTWGILCPLAIFVAGVSGRLLEDTSMVAIAHHVLMISRFTNSSPSMTHCTEGASIVPPTSPDTASVASSERQAGLVVCCQILQQSPTRGVKVNKRVMYRYGGSAVAHYHKMAFCHRSYDSTLKGRVNLLAICCPLIQFDRLFPIPQQQWSTSFCPASIVRSRLLLSAKGMRLVRILYDKNCIVRFILSLIQVRRYCWNILIWLEARFKFSFISFLPCSLVSKPSPSVSRSGVHGASPDTSAVSFPNLTGFVQQ